MQNSEQHSLNLGIASVEYIKRECHLCVLGFPDKNQCERIGFLVNRFGVNVEILCLDPMPDWNYHTLMDFAYSKSWAIIRYGCNLSDAESAVRNMLSLSDCCVVIGSGDTQDVSAAIARDRGIPVRRVY
jgi:hypothetical protein